MHRAFGVGWGLVGIPLAPVLLLEWFGNKTRLWWRRDKYTYFGFLPGDILNGFELVEINEETRGPKQPTEIMMLWREVAPRDISVHAVSHLD